MRIIIKYEIIIIHLKKHCTILTAMYVPFDYVQSKSTYMIGFGSVLAW